MVSVKEVCIRYLDEIGIDVSNINGIDRIRKLYDIVIRNSKIIISEAYPESIDAAVNNLKLFSDYILNDDINSLNKIEKITIEDIAKIKKSRIKMKNTLSDAIEKIKESYGTVNKDEVVITEDGSSINIYEDMKLKEIEEKYNSLEERYSFLVDIIKNVLQDKNVQSAISKEDLLKLFTAVL